MTRQQAKQYVYSLLTERAMLNREIKRLQDRFAKAETRARDADTRGDDPSRQAALSECSNIAGKVESIKADLNDLNGKIKEAEDTIRMHGYGDGPRPSADQLLTDFKEKAGVDPADVSLQEETESARAELALQELKKRMGLAEESETSTDDGTQSRS